MASPAGRTPKSPAPQLCVRPCPPFSPARVDNSLVRASAETPAPLDAPRTWLGYQATCLPSSGAATRFQQPLRLAPPYRPPRGSPGRHRRRGAVPVPRVPVTPLPPHEGALPMAALLEGSGCAAPATGPLRSPLPPCKHLECNAVGLLRQGLAALCAPARWPPLPGCQHG